MSAKDDFELVKHGVGWANQNHMEAFNRLFKKQPLKDLVAAGHVEFRMIDSGYIVKLSRDKHHILIYALGTNVEYESMSYLMAVPILQTEDIGALS